MITLIAQMVGCLIVAAAIGAAVGWLLRQLSVGTLTQHIYDVTSALQVKEQALHSAQLELKAKASTMQIYESKIASWEALARSTEDELAARAEQLTAVQAQLAAATQRMSMLESEHSASLQRFNDSDTKIAAFEHEARQANAARTVAQQELSLKEEELLELQNRLAEIEGNLAEADQLKALLAELEPAQGRVHWLEVQLSEKEVQYRTALHESEEQRAALARRVGELEPLQHRLEKQEETLQDWESKYSKALKQHATDAALMEKQLATIHEIQHTLAERERILKDKDAQVVTLQQQVDGLRALQVEMEKREEEISRLRKRLVEVRAAARVSGESDNIVSSGADKEDHHLHLEIERAKPSNGTRKDDLKKIPGISPGLERALNKMGTYTYVQIAKWTPADIARVARQLETAPDRIKRDKWIAGAKKQHRDKYGEQL